jgi:polyphosphate kinase
LQYFGNAGNAEYYLGSADWMPRNLDRRVEAMVPIEDVQWHRRLQTVLETCLTDNRQAWELGADGQYRRRTPGESLPRATQQTFIKEPWGVAAEAPAPTAPRRATTRARGHARTEGKGRTNPAADVAE